MHWRYGFFFTVRADGVRVLEKRADVHEMSPVQGRVEVAAEAWAAIADRFRHEQAGPQGQNVSVTLQGPDSQWRLLRLPGPGDVMVLIADAKASVLRVKETIPSTEWAMVLGALDGAPEPTSMGERTNAFGDPVESEEPHAAAEEEPAPAPA